MFSALDFFAGSGLVRLGLEPEFQTVWANDVCPKKQAVYTANFPDGPFHLGAIEGIHGSDLPEADLAWASFPCQDLSLAGNLTGMKTGTRSGLFWQWMRVLDELQRCGRKPPLLVAENVVGFVAASEGRHFLQAYQALRERGYRAGAVIIDAQRFVPQSRPRAFLLAISGDVDVATLSQPQPSGPFHPAPMVRAAARLNDPAWIWWSLPAPTARPPLFGDICERAAPCDPPAKTRKLMGMLSPRNESKLDAAIQAGRFFAGTAYRRTRPDRAGNPVQRLEIRFDGVAGCLRTPNGGSSRQTVILVDKGGVRSRLMTVRECARLMGVPGAYRLPGTYNDGYRAMGDAVAAPVTRWLTQHLLAPLAFLCRSARVNERAAENAA